MSGIPDLAFKPTLNAPAVPINDTADLTTLHPFMTSSVEEPNEIPVLNFDDVDATDLEKKIIRQMEFYFGDFNLPKDKFMLEVMDYEDGKVFTFREYALTVDHLMSV